MADMTKQDDAFAGWGEVEDLEPTLVEAEGRAQVQQVFDGAAVDAARIIARVARGETTDEDGNVLAKDSLKAAQYIVDRVLGKPAQADGPAADPWRDLMDKLKANDGADEPGAELSEGKPGGLEGGSDDLAGASEG